MDNEFAGWGLSESVLKAFQEEEVDLKAALVLGESAVARIIPKEGPRATFLAQRKLYLENNTLPLFPTVTVASAPTSNTVSVASSSSGEVIVITEKDAAPRTKKRKVCTEYINDVEEFLDDSVEGRLVLASFKKEGKLCNAMRDQLVHLVVVKEFKKDCTTKPCTSLWENLAREICELFPTESELTYFSRYRRGKKLVVAGRLIVKYHNFRRKLLAVDLVPPSSLEEELRVEEGIDYLDVDLEEDEDLRWLSANSRPWPDVLGAWDRTYVTRMRLVRGLKSKKPAVDGDETVNKLITDVPSYLAYFRPFTANDGWELLVDDFNKIHSGKGQSLTAAYPKLVSFAKARLPAKTLQFLDKQDISFDQKATEFLLLFHQLFKIRNVTTPKGTWRVSRLEVQRSFILHAETEAAWKTVVNDRRECLHTQGLTLQPYLVFIGPLHSMKKWRVVCSDKTWWDFDSPLQALDGAFKAFFATDTAYPPECRHIWTFLQRSVYNIVCSADFVNDKTLKAYLDGDLKEFSSIQV